MRRLHRLSWLGVLALLVMGSGIGGGNTQIDLFTSVTDGLTPASGGGTANFLRADGSWAAPAGGGGGGQLIVPFHADGSANITLTNQANTEQFLGNSNRSITRVDLSDYTEYRLVVRVVTGSASANTPRMYAQFHTSFTTTAATFSPLGASGDVNASLTTAGQVETAWTSLAAGAIADVYLTVLQHGGDAAADPAVGPVAIHFR